MLHLFVEGTNIIAPAFVDGKTKYTAYAHHSSHPHKITFSSAPRPINALECTHENTNPTVHEHEIQVPYPHQQVDAAPAMPAYSYCSRTTNGHPCALLTCSSESDL